MKANEQCQHQAKEQCQQWAKSACSARTNRVESRGRRSSNDAHQAENKIKFFTAEALRGIDSHPRHTSRNAEQAEHRGDSTGIALGQGCELVMTVVVQRQARMVQTVLGGSAIAVHRIPLVETHSERLSAGHAENKCSSCTRLLTRPLLSKRRKPNKNKCSYDTLQRERDTSPFLAAQT